MIICLACARVFHAAGARLILCSRNTQQLERIQFQLTNETQVKYVLSKCTYMYKYSVLTKIKGFIANVGTELHRMPLIIYAAKYTNVPSKAVNCYHVS